MNWRLTPQERRIIEHTKSEGEQASTRVGDETGTAASASAQAPLWRSILAWIGGIVLLVGFAMLMVWVGSLIG